jgi:hypothetical protein
VNFHRISIENSKLLKEVGIGKLWRIEPRFLMLIERVFGTIILCHQGEALSFACIKATIETKENGHITGFGMHTL